MDFMRASSGSMVALFSLSNVSNLEYKEVILKKISEGAIVTLEYGGLERQGEILKTEIDGRVYEEYIYIY